MSNTYVSAKNLDHKTWIPDHTIIKVKLRNDDNDEWTETEVIDCRIFEKDNFSYFLIESTPYGEVNCSFNEKGENGPLGKHLIM